MEFRETEQSGVLVLELFGNLDMLNAGILKERIQEYIKEGGTKVVLDLDQVGFVDSSGFGLMMNINDKLSSTRGGLCIIRVPKTVQQIFKIAKIASVIQTYSSLDEALSYFAQRT